MDLGNLNLRALTASMSGGEGNGSGKTNKQNADGVPETGGFAGLIAALLTGPEGAAPAEASAPGQTLLAKAGPEHKQNLAAQEFAGSIIQVKTEEVAATGQSVGKEMLAANPSLLSSRGAAQPALKPVQAQAQHGQKTKFLSEHIKLDTAVGAKSVATADPAATNTSSVKPAEALKTAQQSGPHQQPVDQLVAIRAHAESGPERSEYVSREGSNGIAPALATDGASSRMKTSGVQQSAQPIVSQVAQQLTYAVRGGMQQIRFQLHPAELGQVSVQLRIRDGATKVVISAENPAAIETMRHSANALHQALQSAGMQLDREHLQFQQQGAGQFAFGDETHRDGGRGAQEDHGPMTGRNEKAEPASGSAPEDGLFL